MLNHPRKQSGSPKAIQKGFNVGPMEAQKTNTEGAGKMEEERKSL